MILNTELSFSVHELSGSQRGERGRASAYPSPRESLPGSCVISDRGFRFCPPGKVCIIHVSRYLSQLSEVSPDHRDRKVLCTHTRLNARACVVNSASYVVISRWSDLRAHGLVLGETLRPPARFVSEVMSDDSRSQ